MTSRAISFLLSLSLFSTTTRAQSIMSKSDNREAQFLTAVAIKASDDKPNVQGFLEEVPDGLNTKDISPACDPKAFEDSVLAKKNSSAEYYKMLKDYFKNCQNELSKNSWKGILSLLKYSFFQYHFFDHPQVKELTIKLSNGIQVPAVVALKQDPTPRPLVILKCGVFCSASESPSMKAYLMSLFDQSPFNVVLLANQTGLDYMALNHYVSLGGWSEGLETLEVGKWLQEKWEFKNRISSLHLMGISLGGNAAVFGAAYNDLYPRTDGSKVFSSVAAICPVISLRPTLDHLFNSPIIGNIFATAAKQQFLDARGDVTDIPDLLADNKIPKATSEMTDFIGQISSTSLQRRGIASTSASFFKNNNFWNLKNKVNTPMLVWASLDDIIVNNKINAQVMEYDDSYEKSPKVGVLNLPYGSHCGFSAAYGMLASTVVMKTFVLNHSPEFIDKYSQQQMNWDYGFKKLYPTEQHVGQSWHFTENSDQVKVSFRIFNWNTNACYEQGPWGVGTNCVTTREFSLPISALRNMSARIPRNRAEAEALSREFNAKVEFKTKDLKSLTGSKATEFVMVWRSALE